MCAQKTTQQSIEEKLTAALAPLTLTVKNESHLHAGHAGAPGEGEDGHGASHFRLLVVSQTFTGMSRVARQRKVNEALAEELAGPVHALAMKTLTPDEWAAMEQAGGD